MRISKHIIPAVTAILLFPYITNAGVVINGVTISDSGKIIYLDKTEQGTATLKGDKGDIGPKGDLGDKVSTGFEF